MLKEYGINDENILKIAVVATMSSGKSTFINALIGKDILPSKNEACTARVIPIINNDSINESRAYVSYSDGNKEVLSGNKEIVESFNTDSNIDRVLIECNIDGVRNINKSVVLFDTPGTNFSEDRTHKEATYSFLKRMNEGLIVYIINATQFGINDDKELLLHINSKLKESQNKLDVLFVINKLDEFDLEKEDIDSTISEIREYIEDKGIKNPQIIPVSALAAKQFRLAINGCEFTRKERRAFENYYDLLKNDGFNFRKLSESPHINNINVNDEIYSQFDLKEAVNNTGITLVEDYIRNLLSLEQDGCNHKIEFMKDEIKSDIEKMLNELSKIYTDKFVRKKCYNITSSIEAIKLSDSKYKKIKSIYDQNYAKCSKIMSHCIINRCSDHGKLKEIVKDTLEQMEKAI